MKLSQVGVYNDSEILNILYSIEVGQLSESPRTDLKDKQVRKTDDSWKGEGLMADGVT